MKKIIIAIDGYSSCGKSTFAKMVAADLGYIFIDTGAMYRAVTLYAMQHGFIDADQFDTESIIKSLDDIHISFKYNDLRKASDIFLNKINVEEEIRAIEVSDNVSTVSQISEVREYLVKIQQEMGVEKGIVMDGRDIGTVVFPNAELKIFMTADPEVRAMRRFKEFLEGGKKISFDEILENIRKRDFLDTNRDISPLKRAEDALILDNSRMSIEEQMIWIKEKIDKSIRKL